MPNTPPTHRPKQPYVPPTPAKAMARKIRNSRRWRKVRKQVLAMRPICEYCDRPGEQVHHVQPLHTHPELAFVDENLASVCTACHSKLENGAELARREFESDYNEPRRFDV